MPGNTAKYATVHRGNRSFTYRRHPVVRYFVMVLSIGVVIGALGVFGIALAVLAAVGWVVSRLNRSRR
jgi:small-conductance mechanosensitive channel